MSRYDRQVCLPEIGKEGQNKIRDASILCVGAGGLGSPALLYLAAAGLGRIGIIDFDRVEESNLQRQVLFSNAEIGLPKAFVAAEKLRAMNPEIRVDSYDGELTVETAEKLIPQYDVILDGTDNFEAKFLINDAAVKYCKPWIYGAIQGFEGQAAVFNHQGGPCYRCLYPERPMQPVRNCAEAGVIGAVAGIVGVTQALQAIQIITGHAGFSPLSARLLLVDTRTMQSKTLSLKKNPQCPVCSRPAIEISLTYPPRVCATAAIPEISRDQLKSLIGHILVDVREREEWQAGHIEGAILWPLSKILVGALPLDLREKPIVLYCQKGIRSLQAAMILKDNGFVDISHLSGGYESCV
ncbi:MAG: HesA/MoeB/ThiF family protein [Alphaproteobacteria bacterium]|nr:HesA/MoeB/ThiF family protein [Alphaproteobacteria bacterium]QQS56087.1 MAG: HesA/MoeB/ThiF family protein [Alphaproteobacteria bacterium]